MEYPADPQEYHTVNWLENTARLLAAQLPRIASCAPELSESMAGLLLKRLPEDIRESFLQLLPENVPHPEIRGAEDRGLHYVDFVRQAREAVYERCPELSGRLDDDALDSLAERTAETFFWAVAQGLPLDLKDRIARVLPVEMASRMNLFSGTSEESKVA